MRRSLRKMSWRRATSLVVSIAIVMTFLTAMSTNAVGREEAGLQLEDVTMVATPNTFITNGSTFACKISYKMPLDLSGYTEQVLVVAWPGGLTVQGNVTFTIGGGAPIAAGTTMTSVYNYTLTGSNFQSAAGLVVEFTINYRLLGWITGRPIPINAALASKPVGDDYATDAELSVTVSPNLWDAGPVTVTYVGTGSTSGNPPVDSNSPYKAGDPVKVLGNTGTPKLEKTGYEFAGWERDIVPNRLVSEYAIAELAPGWTITGTGEPGYELTIRYYTSNNTPITQTSSGQPLTNITTVVGADGRWAYTLPAWLQNEAAGWRFGGEYTTGQPTTIDYDVDDEFDMLHNNIVLRPKWADAYTVTYKANGGTGADVVENVVFDQMYTILGNTMFTAPTGYISFTGWNTAEDGTGTAYAAGTQITIKGDVILHAQWTPVAHTVTYKANGGTGADVVNNVVYDQVYTILDNMFTEPTGYIGFAGWNTAANGTGTPYAAGAQLPIKGDVILYAQWTPSGGTTPTTGGGTPTVIATVETPLDPIFIADHVAYIIGYPEGDVRPGNNITRAEVATVFFRLLDDKVRAENWIQENSFTDVNVGNWYNNAVSVMSNMGIVNGYNDGTFKPNGAITRAELATIAARFAKMMGMGGDNEADFIDISGHWAQDDINFATSTGWLTGYPDKTFKPNQPISRAEFMTLVNRMTERVPETPDDLLVDEMVVWSDNADTSKWYYLAVQEATNSHIPEYKEDIVPDLQFGFEFWVEMLENPDWALLEKTWADGHLETEG